MAFAHSFTGTQKYIIQATRQQRNLQNLAQVVGKSMKAADTMYQTNFHPSAAGQLPTSREGPSKTHGAAISAM